MWEEIENQDGISSERLKVHRGWIVRSKYTSSWGVGLHQVFIEDEFHQWKLTK